MENKIIDKYKSLPKQKRILYVIGIVITYLIVQLLITYCVGTLFLPFNRKYDYSALECAIFSKSTRPITIIAWIAVTALFVYFLLVKSELNTVKKTDEKGVNYQNKKTFGSSEILEDENEISDISFKIDDIHNTKTTVYGQLMSSEYGEKIIGYQDELPPNIPEGSRNTFVLATMGSGKSFSYVRTEILQALKRGDSILVTDPSMELTRDIYQIAKKYTNDVKVLNVNNPQYSDFWDCLEEVINPETERIDGTRLGKFATTYMRNCAAVKKEDFWYKCALNLVATIIGLIAYEREEYICDYLTQIYEKLEPTNEEEKNNYKKYLNRLKHTEEIFVSIKETKEKIYYYANLLEIPKSKIDEAIQSVINSANKNHPFTIKNVYERIMEFGEETENMLKCKELDQPHIPNCNPARYYADIYIKEAENPTIKTSAIHGTQQCFGIFAEPNNRELVSRPGIHLCDINKHQCVYFVVTSDTGNKDANVLASLFFSFALIDAQDNYSKDDNERVGQNRPNKCVPVSAIFDEFFSLGVIMGDEKEFGTFMSDSRKRKIYVSIILQYYPQLKINYGEDCKHLIQGGCGTLLFLSGNDPETLEFIQEFIGESTVQIISYKKMKGLFTTVNSNEYSVSDAKRYTVSKGEARMWEKGTVMIAKEGENPVKAKLFPWILHPLYSECEPINVFSLYKPLKEIIDSEFDEKYNTDGKNIAEEAETEMGNKIAQLKIKYENKKTGEIVEYGDKKQEIKIGDKANEENISFDSLNYY